MNSKHEDGVHTLWDDLADFEAARTDDALEHLLHAVSGIVNAQKAYWLGAVRVTRDAEEHARDPLNGWRPANIRYLDTLPADLQIYRHGIRNAASTGISESVVNHARNAGRFRAVLLRDHVSPAFFESALYDVHFRQRNAHDALFVVCPVNEDAESYYCFMRDERYPLFEAHERDRAASVLRALKWFHRQVMLSYGLLVATEPLTNAERRVAEQLLTPQSEKAIAKTLGMTPATIHSYVTAIYRKFGVTSRAGLTALWLRRG
jgi:DNA-binding CsgD family transcriptional regulator